LGEDLRYQLRVDLPERLAALARADQNDPALAPLPAILEKHRTVLKCQYDAFADYCAEAEREGVANYPLYEWTRATIEDPAKKAKYLKSFTLYVGGAEVYPKAEADALEADLRPLAGGKVVSSLARYDTDPANNPQPPAR
jgi:hypothetical protein